MEGLLACWTRKEALLKATGEGIGGALGKVEVTLTPWEEPEILPIPKIIGGPKKAWPC